MPGTKKLITMTRSNGTSYDTLYPRTLASQVFYDEANNKTVADHITDTDAIHLSAAERTMINAVNTSNGILQLDANGYVPSANLNPSVLAITTEFADIAALTAAGAAATVANGQLVMVTDASADTTVTSGWAIYRKRSAAGVDYTIVNDVAESTPGANDGRTAGWQKIAENESLDVVVEWANIANGPSSTAAQVDDAVTKAHTHANKAIIDEFADTGTAQDPVLTYKSKQVAFSENVITVQVVESGSEPAANTLKEGDMVLVVTGTVA